jgi:hypothetical protein
MSQPDELSVPQRMQMLIDAMSVLDQDAAFRVAFKGLRNLPWRRLTPRGMGPMVNLLEAMGYEFPAGFSFPDRLDYFLTTFTVDASEDAASEVSAPRAAPRSTVVRSSGPPADYIPPEEDARYDIAAAFGLPPPMPLPIPLHLSGQGGSGQASSSSSAPASMLPGGRRAAAPSRAAVTTAQGVVSSSPSPAPATLSSSLPRSSSQRSQSSAIPSQQPVQSSRTERARGAGRRPPARQAVVDTLPASEASEDRSEEENLEAEDLYDSPQETAVDPSPSRARHRPKQTARMSTSSTREAEADKQTRESAKRKKLEKAKKAKIAKKSKKDKSKTYSNKPDSSTLAQLRKRFGAAGGLSYPVEPSSSSASESSDESSAESVSSSSSSATSSSSDFSSSSSDRGSSKRKKQKRHKRHRSSSSSKDFSIDPKNVKLQSHASRRVLRLHQAEREGMGVYRSILRAAISASAYVRGITWVQTRNKHEAMTLARVVDVYVDMFGAAPLSRDDHMEVLLRRLSAVVHADSVGNWEEATGLEESPEGLMTAHSMRMMRTARKIAKVMRATKKQATTATPKSSGASQGQGNGWKPRNQYWKDGKDGNNNNNHHANQTHNKDKEANPQKDQSTSREGDNTRRQ